MTALTSICDQVGITYRQADYWIRQGYVSVDTGWEGPGNRRDITPDEAAHFDAMAQLVAHGIAPEVAARHTDRLIAQGFRRGDKITVDVAYRRAADALEVAS